MQFEDLIDHFVVQAETKPRLVKVMVELTYGCNLRCVHCYNPTHVARNELDTAQVRRILDQLAAEGCLWVGFTGGELFTRKDAFELLAHAKSLGLVISLVTNATLITPTIADRIGELDPYEIEISIYGATAVTYESVTRIPGSFLTFVRGVDLLLERRLAVVLKPVVVTLNAHELEAMEAFARNRGLPSKVCTEIQPRVDGSQEPLRYRISPEEAFAIWRRRSGEALKQVPPEKCGSAGKLFDCLCGKSSAAITPHGKMNLCVSMDTPRFDVNQGTIAQGWSHLVNLVARTKPGSDYECDTCSMAALCTRGSMDGWLEQGAFDASCLPHFRDLAERKTMFLKPDEKESTYGRKTS
jgi:radical SAM protein with 4Fe4S-binding SPASM domain